MKDTIVINFFGGPGVGKSTIAAQLFTMMKKRGMDCELVTEFAKDKVWEENKEAFKNQLYLTGKQYYKITRCLGKVKYVITDSPILLGGCYNSSNNPHLLPLLLFEHNLHKNLNIFLKRNVPYDVNGRNQTLEEAILLDEKIKQMLDTHHIPYFLMDVLKIDEEFPILIEEINKNYENNN